MSKKMLKILGERIRDEVSSFYKSSRNFPSYGMGITKKDIDDYYQRNKS